jgi:hypothetical protein
MTQRDIPMTATRPGLDRSCGWSRGVEIASCERGSLDDGGVGAVFAGICVSMTVAGVVGVGMSG